MTGVIYVRRFGAELRAGEYRRLGDRVELACICCGAVAELDQEHVVDAEGYVSPIWLCEAESCGMVGVFVLFEGWNAVSRP